MGFIAKAWFLMTIWDGRGSGRGAGFFGWGGFLSVLGFLSHGVFFVGFWVGVGWGGGGGADGQGEGFGREEVGGSVGEGFGWEGHFELVD